MSFVLLASAPAALAQKWEVGVAGGGNFYTSQTVSNPAGNATAGLANGFALGGWLGSNINNLLGGELRYDYDHSDLKLSSGGTSVSFPGQSNAIHYDLLMHFAPSESPVRPFLAAGAGVKIYSGIGHEQPFQPLSNVALLTQTHDIRPLISVGGGIKFALAKNTQLRVEVHDFLTPFPQTVIAPAEGSKVGGWLSDFVVMAGLSFGL
jgi:opacity protein-like surface antigen